MIKNGLTYLFNITSKHGDELYFTSSSSHIHHDNKVYVPFSGLSVFSGEFNDSAQNKIILHGIFEDQGITSDQDLVGSNIKIIIFEYGKANELVTYICTKRISEGLEFKLVCEPEIIKLNQSLLPVFSKTCRANFCDKDCKLDINNYKIEVSVVKIEGNSLFCTDLSKHKNNYFSGGKLFVESNSKQYEYDIKSHYANKIELLHAHNITRTMYKKRAA